MPAGVEVRRDRDIGLFGAGKPRVLLDQACDCAGIGRGSDVIDLRERRDRKRVRMLDQPALDISSRWPGAAWRTAALASISAIAGAAPVISS